MPASIAYRWLNADRIVLSALYGPGADAVLSRPARKPVASCQKPAGAAGIPIPCRNPARAA